MVLRVVSNVQIDVLHPFILLIVHIRVVDVEDVLHEQNAMLHMWLLQVNTDYKSVI